MDPGRRKPTRSQGIENEEALWTKLDRTNYVGLCGHIRQTKNTLIRTGLIISSY